jgi:zinc protease
MTFKNQNFKPMGAITRLSRFMLIGVLGAALSLSAFGTTQIERLNVEGGAQVYLVSTPNLPMLDVQIDFDAGSRRDPAGLDGVSNAVAMMISKGTRASATASALDENQIGEAWADLGATLMASSSQDRFSFRLRTLTDPSILSSVVELAAQQMALPAFDAKVFERERAKALSSLKESLTQPSVLANRAFAGAIYPDHPYGSLTTPESIEKTTVQDLERFYKQYVNLCSAKISMVGNLNKAQATDVANRLLREFDHSSSCKPEPFTATVKPLLKGQELHIALDSAQAHVLMGQPSIARSDPDYFALTVGNYVLGGGGFVSRLTEQVREKRGLSYSVYSYFAPAVQAGPFTLGLQTRPDQAEQALLVSKQVLTEFVKDGPTDKELQAAKANLIGSFPLRLDSNKKLLDNLSNIAWNNLPLNYLETWVDSVAHVSKQQIKEAFQKHLQPETMVTVIVGGKFEAR